ncbi:MULTISPECIES: sensor histidine kinase [unclassified Oceanispirochaeta]|uniref:sensor histidine kinase n=1 Tax=unclassified Oceanispirochaeta TaxID=2635722 RepID=UPI000E09030E|nr:MULTISPECIES: PAS domain-containing sensor histidine kinase [unclassified Oceanispirochaeta]MBF9017840.1 PAS domain S-box protein [Oceanispirochaeta sp. M2]NPD74300.1 PAS domain-containing sensor histidine kinase [Oceanispirochaeta sp. M1]RDG29888.1 PAS domain-containing sensor histidine kinase [Oceanispirochaeta sp. M1]
MKKPSGSDADWDALRQQIIGLGEGSHSKNYYPALKQSRDALIRFRGVVEEIPDMILIVDDQGNILDLNRAAEKVFSKSRKELMNLSVDLLLEGRYDILKSGTSEVDRLFADEEDGVKIYRELEVRPVRVEHKSLWVVIGRNVTYRIKAEQELRLVNENLEELVQERTASIEEQMVLLKDTQNQLILSAKMAVLGTLVAGVAHEINNPLGIGITASSALVSKIRELKNSQEGGNLTEEDFIDFLDYLSQSASLIQTNLERAGELVKSFKQVAVDQSSEQSRKIFILLYLEEVVQSLYPQWKKHRVHIMGDENIQIKTVPGDWSQILTNLIINSVVHGFREIKTGGEVEIRVSRERDDLVVHYKDNGCGLSDEQIEKIFDPFYTTARESGGTGLGMHIVYNIVTLRMGGDIRTNRMDKPGSSFSIRIPL